MRDCFLQDQRNNADLVSVLDELLGNLHEFFKFFRHGGVGGLRKCQAWKQTCPHELVFPTKGIIIEALFKGTISSPSLATRLDLLKTLPENCRRRRRPVGA